MISNQQIKEILLKAVFAPSGDNSQPWYFEVKNNELYIYNDPNKDLRFYNYNQCGSYVAHGALIENISILASEIGFDCNVKYLPEVENNLVAILSFSQCQKEKDILSDYILKRVTNRKPYNEKALSQEDVDCLRSTNKADNVELKFINEKEKIKEISLASVVNEMTVLKTKEIHKYFFKHVLWSEKEEKEKRTGLYVKTLEMPKPQEIAFRMASYWPVMNIAGKLGVVEKIANDNSLLFQASPMFIAFLCKSDSALDFISVGRSLQRVWLTCASRGLSAHPITGVLFLNQTIKNKGGEEINSKLKGEISMAYSKICNQIGSNGKNVLFLLRVGYSAPPSASSSRLEPVISFR